MPSRSPRAVKYGMEKLSGSRPRPHIQCTIQSAMYRRISTWGTEGPAYSHRLSPGGARGHTVEHIRRIPGLGEPQSTCGDSSSRHPSHPFMLINRAVTAWGSRSASRELFVEEDASTPWTSPNGMTFCS